MPEAYPVSPEEIEQKSFAIITEAMGGRTFPPEHKHIIQRVIHTTADFDYMDTLTFSEGAAAACMSALKQGCAIVTDTQMVLAGINKKAAKALGVSLHCFIADKDVAEEAAARGCTRAMLSMEKAARLPGPVIFAIGNAPTALFSLCRLISEENLKPAAIIGVPVGFVNVVESKEMLMAMPVPWIVAKGRKGGSNVAAAIVNALLYSKTR